MEKILGNIIKNTIKDKYNLGLNEIKLDTPPRKELGDFAFGVFGIVKELKTNPKIIAEELAGMLNEKKEIEEAKADGPYINIKLSKNIFVSAFLEMYNPLSLTFPQKGDEEKRTPPKLGLVAFSPSMRGTKGGVFPLPVGEGLREGGIKKNSSENIIIDYIGANVGKPLHIGHMCTPNIGQTLCNLYRRLGYNVIGDSHIGDWGIIFGKLILAYKMWGEKERLEKDAVNYLFELYVKVSAHIDEAGIDGEQKARDEFKLLSEGNKESVGYWKEFTSYSIENLNKELARLNIKQDFDIGESFYEGIGLPKIQDYPDLKWSMSDIVEELIEKGIATKNEDNSVGIIFPENTKIPSCILQKRDGTKGYLASDLACIKYRMDNWNPKKIIYSIDVRQQLHLRQVFEVSKMAGWIGEDVELFHAYNGFISLKDGAMSTRKGRIIKLEDLLDEAEKRASNIILEKRQDVEGEELKSLARIIGIGAIKYGYLKKSRETDIVFDWDEFMTFDGNSGPYIQYSYVRAIRILENFNGDYSKEVEASFENDEETALVKQLLDYKNVLLETAEKNMPHLLCQYAYNLTKTFSKFYDKIHILNEEDEGKKILRLKLVDLFAKILKDTFSILGIEMPEKM